MKAELNPWEASPLIFRWANRPHNHAHTHILCVCMILMFLSWCSWHLVSSLSPGPDHALRRRNERRHRARGDNPVALHSGWLQGKHSCWCTRRKKTKNKIALWHKRSNDGPDLLHCAGFTFLLFRKAKHICRCTDQMAPSLNAFVGASFFFFKVALTQQACKGDWIHHKAYNKCTWCHTGKHKAKTIRQKHQKVHYKL